MAFTPQYTTESPYFYTPILGRFMAYYIHRRVPPHFLDTVIKITNERYQHRPDLLAQDIYGDPDLFWVIPIRNGLQDPIFDIKNGDFLTIPHPSFVRSLI
jgi:hypothetical protein